MPLYKLTRREPEGCWDLIREIVVRAADARQARKLAHAEAHKSPGPIQHRDWLRASKTTCRQVLVEGKPEVIIVDYLEG